MAHDPDLSKFDLVRLAHENPALRSVLVPMLRLSMRNVNAAHRVVVGDIVETLQDIEMLLTAAWDAADRHPERRADITEYVKGIKEIRKRQQEDRAKMARLRRLIR